VGTKRIGSLAGLIAISISFLAPSAPAQATTSLLANVIDRKGDAVRNLTRDEFRIKVNGQPATLQEASYSLAPRRIVALLDMSGSMSGQAGDKRWRIASEATEAFLTDTPADVSVALLTFSDRVHDVFDFSQSRNSMTVWLKQGASKEGDSRIHGRTALFDALLTATKMLTPGRAGDAIYVITDAGDNSSHVHSRAVRELLVKSQIRLFVFLLSEPSPGDMNAGSDSLKEIARATGGFVFGVSGHNPGIEFLPSFTYAFEYNQQTRDRIKLYTRALNIQVNGFYSLRFNLPVAPEKARKVKLEIIDGSGKQRNDLAYTYSTLLLPLAKESRSF
jgi:Mg-chelatase subunit ChlD